ncbi:hypothetical protein FQN60_010360, partial [Etheostoma spectabile]
MPPVERQSTLMSVQVCHRYSPQEQHSKSQQYSAVCIPSLCNYSQDSEGTSPQNETRKDRSQIKVPALPPLRTGLTISKWEMSSFEHTTGVTCLQARPNFMRCVSGPLCVCMDSSKSLSPIKIDDRPVDNPSLKVQHQEVAEDEQLSSCLPSKIQFERQRPRLELCILSLEESALTIVVLMQY